MKMKSAALNIIENITYIMDFVKFASSYACFYSCYLSSNFLWYFALCLLRDTLK